MFRMMSSQPSHREPHDATEADHLVVYGKDECCLCEDAQLFAERVASRWGLPVRFIDIRRHAEFWETYRWRIPLVSMRGRILDEGRVDERRITSELARLLQQRTDSDASR